MKPLSKDIRKTAMRANLYTCSNISRRNRWRLVKNIYDLEKILGGIKSQNRTSKRKLMKMIEKFQKNGDPTLRQRVFYLYLREKQISQEATPFIQMAVARSKHLNFDKY